MLFVLLSHRASYCWCSSKWRWNARNTTMSIWIWMWKGQRNNCKANVDANGLNALNHWVDLWELLILKSQLKTEIKCTGKIKSLHFTIIKSTKSAVVFSMEIARIVLIARNTNPALESIWIKIGNLCIRKGQRVQQTGNTHSLFQSSVQI